MEEILGHLEIQHPQVIYRQISDFLRSNIVDGTIARGSKLPPTSELSKVWGVPVATIQVAMTMLVKEGLLERRDGSVRREELFDLFVAQLRLEFSDVDLALLGLGLLHGHLLALDLVLFQGHGALDTCHGLLDDEAEATRSAGVGVCLQVDAFDFSEGGEVSLQVGVLDVLREAADEQLSVVLVVAGLAGVHLVLVDGLGLGGGGGFVVHLLLARHVQRCSKPGAFGSFAQVLRKVLFELCQTQIFFSF